MAHRDGWKETKIKVSEAIDERLRKIAVARGWSLDTCARKAMKRAARKARISLPGGGDAEVLRRTPENLLAASSSRIWITFPEAWSDGLAALVDASDVHSQIAPLWRAAILDWMAAEKRKLEKNPTEAWTELQAAA